MWEDSTQQKEKRHCPVAVHPRGGCCGGGNGWSMAHARQRGDVTMTPQEKDWRDLDRLPSPPVSPTTSSQALLIKYPHVHIVGHRINMCETQTIKTLVS